MKKYSYSNNLLFSPQSWIYINPSSIDNLVLLVTWMSNNIVLVFLVIRLQRKTKHHVNMSAGKVSSSETVSQAPGASHNSQLHSTATREKRMFLWRTWSTLLRAVLEGTETLLACSSTKFTCSLSVARCSKVSWAGPMWIKAKSHLWYPLLTHLPFKGSLFPAQWNKFGTPLEWFTYVLTFDC